MKIVLKNYVKKQAEKVQGKFNKKYSRVLRSKMTMTEDSVEHMNKGFKNSGIYYELIKEAKKESDK